MARLVKYLLIVGLAFIVGLVLIFVTANAQRGGALLARLWHEATVTTRAPAQPPAITTPELEARGTGAAEVTGVNAAPHRTDTPSLTQTTQNDPEAMRHDDDVRPILTKEIFCAIGNEISLYFDGLVLARDPDAYRFEIDDSGLGGSIERRRWHLTPRPDQVGPHRVTVRVSDADGKLLAEATTRLWILSPQPIEHPANILIVGDSTIHQSLVPNQLWTLLNAWSPGSVRFIGTHHPVPDLPIYRKPLPGVFHEGYGGWAWQTFASHYEPGQEKVYKLPRSPFVFLEDGRPTLDVGRYLQEQGARGKLNAAVFDLGINDTFSANPDDPRNLDASIAAALEWADKLLHGFQDAAPEAALVILLPPPFTRSKAVFQRRYGSIQPEFGDPWRHRRVVQTLGRRMIEHFDGHAPQIKLIPMNAMLDTVDGYWAVDPGHPNEAGGLQIAAALFAVIANALDNSTR